MNGAVPTRSPGRGLTILIPLAWLVAFFLIPLLLVARISVSQSARAIPPYTPHWTGWSELPDFIGKLGIENYIFVFTDNLYAAAYLSSLRLAAISTVVALLVGFPLALAVSRASRRWQPFLVIAIILPFWTSYLIRIYAWIGILKPQGYLEQAVRLFAPGVGTIDLLNSDTALVIGMVYCYLPFMVLPVFAALQRIDASFIEAAADLGAPAWTRFFTIVVPLAAPGLLAGSMLVFIPALGEFVVPDLLGGADTLMIGKVIWTEFFSNRDWPLSSAVAIILLAVMIGPIFLFQRAMARTGGGL